MWTEVASAAQTSFTEHLSRAALAAGEKGRGSAVKPVGRGKTPHGAGCADYAEDPYMHAMGGVGRVPCPADELGYQGPTEPHETDDPAAVQVRPQGNDERKPLERPAAAAQVALEPVQLEAGEREEDHLLARD